MSNNFVLCMILLAVLLIISCKEPEEPFKPLPDYMIERFEPEGELDSVNYMYLEFPDSSIYIADTMDNIIKFDGVGGASISVGLKNKKSNTDYWILIESGEEDIDDNYEFLEVGSYHLYNGPSPERSTEKINGAAFGVITDNISNMSFDGVGHFHVLNKKGDDYKMTFRGVFDLELGNDYKGYTRVKGVYNITYIDSFF